MINPRNRSYVDVTCELCQKSLHLREDSIKHREHIYCRSCTNRVRAKYPQLADKAYHTIGGRISGIYSSQVKRSQKYGWDLPSYTREELLDWVVKQPNYQELMNEWQLSNYSRDKSPSIDRLDDYKPYSFSNIRLVSWDVNNQRGRDDKVNGINSKTLTAVKQYDLDGNLINEYHSIMQAQRKTGIHNTNIYNAARGFRLVNNQQKRVLTAGGFKWEFV